MQREASFSLRQCRIVDETVRMAYRVRQGRNFVTPPTGLSYTGSFLYQMDHLGEEHYTPNPVLEKALDVLFLIHADHELNASCTTVLQTGSSLVDPYSAISYVPMFTVSS